MVDTSDIDDLDPFDLLDTEAERVAGFFDGLDEEGWTKDTRADGWRVREMLAHFDGVEVYHLACLNDEVEALFAKAAEAGATDMDAFNAWIVREREGKSNDEVFSSWRKANAEVRRRLRELGRDGTMSSSVGPYPVGLMTFHVASEYATHADDMHVPIDAAEQEARTSWRERVSLFAVKEAESDAEVAREGDGYRVKAKGADALLSRADFVEAVSARLPRDHPIDPVLRDALRALA